MDDYRFGFATNHLPLNGQTSLFDEPDAQDDGERPRRRSDYYL